MKDNSVALMREYTPAFKEKFGHLGVNQDSWRTIVTLLYPTALTVETIKIVLTMCDQRKLDVFKKPFHIVPMWNSDKNCYVDTVWPGIAELRTTAQRTKDYAGKDRVEYGPMITREFEGERKKHGGKKETIRKTVTFPEWAAITVYRMVKGERVAFEGDPVYWEETYAQIQQSGVPSDMWSNRARGQLAKCAEAAALRQAFPEELGSEYAVDEMEGKAMFAGDVIEGEVVEKKKTMTLLDPPAETVDAGSGDNDDGPRGREGTQPPEEAADETDNTTVETDVDKDLEAAKAKESDLDFLKRIEDAVDKDMPNHRHEVIEPHKKRLAEIVAATKVKTHRDRAAKLIDIYDGETGGA